jgi:nicotinate-nucleotide adenylyltransferase
MKKIAFYGGSFDPVHDGHLTIARKLIDLFALDEFVFVPAFHAPHKKDKKPTSAFHRFAMLCLATNDLRRIEVSKIELDAPEKPYTFETLTKLKDELTNAVIFFVMGADSWIEITTWREWEKVLTLTNVIVVTRPGYDIGFSHVTEEIRVRIVDLREKISSLNFQVSGKSDDHENRREKLLREDIKEGKLEISDLKFDTKIFITDAVQLDISATEIRRKVREGENGWRELVPEEVAKYVEKYDIY